MDRWRPYPWLLRALWASLPFVAGPALAQGLDERSTAVRAVASAGLWGGWAVVLCATLVLHPLGLTLLRMAAPAAVVAAAWSVGPASDLPALAAVLGTVVAMVVALLPETAVLFVNGPAYPNERRYPLRPPGALLLGPIPLAWAAAVAAPGAAVLLLAAGRWVTGGVVALVAVGGGFVGGRALHGLSRRWVVFVPAGVVLHDPMSLADPVLFRRQVVAALGPAPADTDAFDLTQRAPGLALQLDLTEEATLVLVQPGHRVGPTVAVRRVLFTPTRPGRVLEEAGRRRLAGAPR
ncbi:MAG: hypothetical protein KY458_04915 [Actinobacteria bacterium]|nr:hypothetical protein [Actinomycetota bacterium]